MFGKNFPVAEYLRTHILDARTVSRSGGWWTAVLLIEDPRNGKPYLALYRWQRRHDEWKKASSFKINSTAQLVEIVDCLLKFSPAMTAGEQART